MRPTSRAFPDGGIIPRRFTCDGEELSPPLAWTDVPPDARSFALLCDDPDAPAGTWRHWAIYDIPADRTELAEDADRRAAKEGFKQATNDFRRPGYGGPCPPSRHGPHRYHFRLLGLSIPSLPLRGRPTCKDVEREARKHVLAEATLIGIYQR
jgi:hypothetical protein